MSLRMNMLIVLLGAAVTSCNGDKGGARSMRGSPDAERHNPPAELGIDTMPADTIMPRDTATIDTSDHRPD